MRILLILIIVSSILIPQLSARAAHPQFSTIQSLDGSIKFDISVGDEMGGANLAFTDLGDDGISEILVAGGLGSEPRVRVLRQDGSLIGSFLAYAPNMGVGINIVACDLTGDGYPEIITAPKRGGGPHIRIFNRLGEAIDSGGFFAYDKTFRGGVNLACGDLEEDSRAELVTLPAPGGGPHVKIWSWNEGSQLTKNFFVFDEKDRSGLVGVIDDHALIVSQQHSKNPIMKKIVIHNSPITIQEKNISLDALGVQSITVAKNSLYLSTATNGLLSTVDTNIFQRVSEENNSVILASDGQQLIYSAGGNFFIPTDDVKRIEVDISQQRLAAYEHGILQNTFLISSGLNNATPLGKHSILAKIPLVHYAWFYGQDSAYNYDLGWVPYNLRFYPHIYIHYAPWHNNFGHQMSHGCVNVSLEDMKWLYEWAQEGIEVEVRE